MHISIQNLGPVKNGEFDLKPLTVFIGDNRQGKTQALYTAAAALDKLGYAAYTDRAAGFDAAVRFPEIERLYTEITQKENTTLDLIEHCRTYGQEYFNGLAKIIPAQIPGILGSRTPYENTNLTFTLSEKEQQTLEKELCRREINTHIPGLGIKLVKEKDKKDLFIYKTETYSEQIPKSEILRLITGTLTQLYHEILYPGIYYFPSDRNSISTILKIVANKKSSRGNNPFGSLTSSAPDSKFYQHFSSQLSDFFGDSIENILSGIPYPSQRFISAISDLLNDTENATGNRLKNTSKDEVLPYINLAALLSEKIAGEGVYLQPNKTGLAQEIVIKKDGDELDIPLASSGVKGLMGLILYLRHYAEKGNTIIIDEPEENLHPTQQTALAEFLAILVNSGINVAITTHSPYIVEHLETLILAHDLKDKTGVKEKLILKREDAYIAKENVSCCLFKEGTIENILWEDGQINWQTFCDTANIIDDISIFVNYLRDREKEDKNAQSIDTAVAEEKGEYHT